MAYTAGRMLGMPLRGLFRCEFCVHECRMQEKKKQKRKLAFTKFKDKRRKIKKKEEAVKEKPKGMEGRKKNKVKKTNIDENGNGVLDM